MKTKTLLGALAVFGLLAGPAAAQVTVDTAVTNLFEPYGVAVDADSNFYIADSANHRILRVDYNTGTIANFAGQPGVAGTNNGAFFEAHLSSPQGIILVTHNGAPGLLVADTGSHTIRFVNLTNAFVTTIAGAAGVAGTDDGVGDAARFNAPTGLTSDGGDTVYIADLLNNRIRVLTLSSGNVTNVPYTDLYQPAAVAFKSANELWVADTRNHTIKLIDPATGDLHTLIGSNNRNISGTTDSQFGANARFNQPRGLLWLGAAGLLISDTANHSIRVATNFTLVSPTNYGVATFAGTPGQSGFVNGSALAAKFSSPVGLARDLLGSAFLVADRANNAVRRIQNGPVQPPVSNPTVGWVDFEQNGFGTFVTILRTDEPFVFNNDRYIAFLAEGGTETFFTFGPTPPSPLEDTIPTPSRITGISAPSSYRNGIPYYTDFLITPLQYSISIQQPDFVIKAIGVQDGRRPSSVVQARFQFKVANPIIAGENAASFRVWNITDGAVMWYTTDGTDPVPNGPNQITGTASLPGIVSLNASEGDIVFKIRGYRNNYKDSDIVTKVFSPSNYVPTRITFGLTNGEPSSKFIARPGQFFYAPVTLQLPPESETMYSLQFNAAVTNGLGSPPISPPGAGQGFFSSLMAQVPVDEGTYYPPADGQWYLTIPPYLYATFVFFTTNAVGEILTNYVATPFTPSIFVNGANNLLGVGWLYRTGFKYRFLGDPTGESNIDFDTTKHDLIQYSIAHDSLFNKDNRVVTVGGYSFQVPTNATSGDQYFIQLGSPSATRDGVGAPGADVYIRPPATPQAVTVGTPSYLVGDVAPFRWFNAGDFGNSNLLNDDVMQVFQSAILGVNMPPANSDFFFAMDSSGRLGTNDGFNNYYVEGDYYTNVYGSLLQLTNGTETTINEVAFGDGQLDVTDVFVTFRRSLDPSTYWFRRFWDTATSRFVAVTNANLAFNSNSPSAFPPPPPPPNNGDPATFQQSFVSFSAGDSTAGAGQTVQIPITARVLGDYPLRVLGLSLTVRPLDGSPAITQPVQFAPHGALGAPTIPGPQRPANVSASWLNSGIAGLSGDAPIGTLTVTLPANAPASAAYAIHFDHASGSPNGLASFPKKTQTGLITLSDRSASSWNDGIPDSWRLRHFGTVHNLLSAATADADGDGATTWEEFKAGTNPNDAASVLRLRSERGQSQECVIRWPSATGKQYVVERCSNLNVPVWSAISTNAGTGFEIEFRDTSGGDGPRFYRVRPLD